MTDSANTRQASRFCWRNRASALAAVSFGLALFVAKSLSIAQAGACAVPSLTRYPAVCDGVAIVARPPASIRVGREIRVEQEILTAALPTRWVTRQPETPL